MKWTIIPIIFMLLIASLNISFSQDELFQTVEESSLQITNGEQGYLDSLNNDSTILSYSLVEIINPVLFGSGEFQITLPDSASTELDGLILNYYFNPDSSFGIYSQIDTEGRLAIVGDDEGQMGQLWTGSELWKFYPFREDISAFIKYDTALVLHPIECPLSGIDPGNDPDDPCPDPPEDCREITELLIILPNDFKLKYVNKPTPKQPPISLAASYIAFSTESILNEALANSLVNNTRIAVTVRWVDYTPTNLIDPGFTVVEMDGEPEIDDLRVELNPDLVFLLIPNNYPLVSGIVSPSFPATDLGNSYGIVEWEFAFFPQYVFSHEIGHSLNARHEREIDPTLGCNHAWMIPNVFKFTCVSAHPSQQRINHYSNPNVNYLGNPLLSTGNFRNYNAHHIVIHGCESYKIATSKFFSSSIFGIQEICPITSSTELEVVVVEPLSPNPGIPPYKYEWRWSIRPMSPLNQGTVFGGQGSTVVVPPFTQGVGSFYVRSIVTSSDNRKSVSDVLIRVRSSCYFSSVESIPNTFQSTKGDGLRPEDELDVSFNINNDIIQIEYHATGDSYIQFFNSKGQLIDRSKHFSSEHEQVFLEIPILNWAVGLYFIEVIAMNQRKTTKIFIKK